MIDNVWEQLTSLNVALATGQTLADLPLEQRVFAVYLEAVEEEMFLAAAHRLAERRGLATYRVDIEDGMPSFLLALGTSPQACRQGIEDYAKRHQCEQVLHLDDV